MVANEIAAMVDAVWREVPSRFPGVALDAMIVMPDHLHGVVMLGADPEVDTGPSLGDVIKYFKGQTSIRYFDQVRAGAWPPVRRRLWQQKYFDRIVRNQRELENIRWYIETNPVRWWSRHEAGT
jgi:REP element-mobilizing transposase RayT